MDETDFETLILFCNQTPGNPEEIVIDGEKYKLSDKAPAFL